MRKKVLYGLVVLLFLSVVQFNISDTYAGKIDYKKIYENQCRKCQNNGINCDEFYNNAVSLHY